mmetsp:Transcript_38400/g.56569  ORF Transcript_38400/g.56569 Transcript_38400/m.56569 type:complete len:231 (+) Transcript_38400:500-1192(+)
MEGEQKQQGQDTGRQKQREWSKGGSEEWTYAFILHSVTSDSWRDWNSTGLLVFEFVSSICGSVEAHVGIFECDKCKFFWKQHGRPCGYNTREHETRRQATELLEGSVRSAQPPQAQGGREARVAERDQGEKPETVSRQRLQKESLLSTREQNLPFLRSVILRQIHRPVAAELRSETECHLCRRRRKRCEYLLVFAHCDRNNRQDTNFHASPHGHRQLVASGDLPPAHCRG